MITKFYLKGLDCIGCATKIEKALKEHLKEVELNSVTKTLVIDDNYKEEAQSIINSIEPEVQITRHKQTKDENSRIVMEPQILLIGFSAFLFTLGIIFRSPLSRTPYAWAEYAVFLLAYFLVGLKVVISAFTNIRHKAFFDETFLMTVATAGAIAIGELPEATGVMLFYAVGEAFQNKAVNKSRNSIKSLMNIRPDFARIIQNGQENNVSPKEVPIGSIILVKPGEKIPLDGKIVSGSSFVDTSALTGEPVPKRVSTGDTILSGMINIRGPISIKTTKSYPDSSVSKILDLVEKAANRKAPTEKFITTFARYYTPAMILIALGIAIIPPVVIPGAALLTWIYRALVILVISCPCALVISIPLGYFGGIGRASAQGILIKGANFLDALTKTHTIVFDKTGTLTTGSFEVSEIKAVGDISSHSLLKLAAKAEINSNHPIAHSILSKYQGNIDRNDISNYEEIAGCGIKATIDNSLVLAGNSELMNKYGIKHTPPITTDTVIHIAKDNNYKGYILISDKLKSNTVKAIKAIRKLGVKKIVMLTGDNKEKATEIAGKLGIDTVYAQLLPEDKLSILEDLHNDIENKTNNKLAYIGDGINDAPAITRSDIGIAMGGMGQDAAIEAADVVIMNDDPLNISRAINTAISTRKVVMQNIALSLGVKAIVVILGAYGMATMWGAVFADVGVTLLALMNSINLTRGLTRGQF